MSEKAKPPRLYQIPKDGTWVIRDKSVMRRTGCSAEQREEAEKYLAAYIADKYKARTSEKDSDYIAISDALIVYAEEHCTTLRAPERQSYAIQALAKWWSSKVVSEISQKTCTAYTEYRRGKGVTDGTVKRELATLRAAVRHWHRAYGPLSSVPIITMPAASNPRSRWLERKEAARLLGAALGFYVTSDGSIARAKHRINRHLARLIILGLYTGSRLGVLTSVCWDKQSGAGYVNFTTGIMHRRADKELESSKRRPPVKLGRRLLAHLHRWHRIDMAELRRVERETGALSINAFRNIVSVNGQAVTDIRTAWDSARALAGLDKEVTPHTLRHTRATWLMQHGVPMWEAAGSLGMSVKVLEEVYGHHHADFQSAAAEI